MSSVAEVMKLARDLVGLARRMGGVLPVDISDLPVKALAAGIADRGDQLGLIWRLVPGTIGTPGTGGEMRVTLDGDATAIAATSMIGRLPVGARVFVILSPPAGVHIVGFMGYDFPPSVTGEAIGRPRMIQMGAAGFTTSNTALTPVPDLQFTAAANAVYEIRFRGSPAATASDDYQIDWTVPSGAGMDRYGLYVSLSQAGTPASPLNITNLGFNRMGNTTAAQGTGIPSPASSEHWEDALLKTGATGGTVQLRFARVTAASGAVTLRANSYMVVQRYR